MLLYRTQNLEKNLLRDASVAYYLPSWYYSRDYYIIIVNYAGTYYERGVENERGDEGRDDRKSVSQDQILGRERGQGKNHFPYSANHKLDWQPHPDEMPSLLYVMTIHILYIYLRA